MSTPTFCKSHTAFVRKRRKCQYAKTCVFRDLREYLDHIMKSTNMSCLTPEKQLEGDCGFLSANMYARSIFGEDALANLSIERSIDGPIIGHIRIRSKTQGIALSLGDKITIAQKRS